ncbi:unnamed protein product, partial [Iphiclides podalirius]
MRDGSWTGAILGRLNLVVRAGQMVKLVFSFRDAVCLLLMTTRPPIHSTPATATGAQPSWLNGEQSQNHVGVKYQENMTGGKSKIRRLAELCTAEPTRPWFAYR